jgi:hypothetical protein
MARDDKGVCSVLTSNPKEPAVRDIAPMPSAGIVTLAEERSVAATNRGKTVDLSESVPDRITATAQRRLPSAPATDISAAGGAGAAGSRQTSEALQAGASEGGTVDPLDPTELERRLPNPALPSVFDAPSSLGQTDKRSPVVLAQVSRDHYDVRQGTSRIGFILFCNGQTQFGWRFVPIEAGLRPSRKLHPNPESCLKGRFLIASVLTRNDDYL